MMQRARRVFVGIIVLMISLLILARSASPVPQGVCGKRRLFYANGILIWSSTSAAGLLYKSGLAIDADGAYRAYHPNDRLGLDSLAHAGHPGNWWALVTDNEKRSGRPVVQLESDPAPGYYVSTTALYDAENANVRDPHRYVDAVTIPYVVIHPKLLNLVHLGDFATVLNLQNDKMSGAIVADVSARNLPVGEGSIALAEAIGIESSPRRGGVDGGVVYLIYPNSGDRRPRTLQETIGMSRELFESWGGGETLHACWAAK
jgi:hypothetical protein